MSQRTHERAAELHNLAAHAHTAAAVAHDKGDRLSAHELSTLAHEHSANACNLAEELAHRGGQDPAMPEAQRTASTVLK